MDEHPTSTDVVLGLVLTALAILQLSINWRLVAERNLNPFMSVVLVILCVAPLIWRRRFPVAVLLVMTVFLTLKVYLEIPEGLPGNAVLLAFLSAAAY